MPIPRPTAPLHPGPTLRSSTFRIQQVDYAPTYHRGPHAHDTTSLTLVLDGAFRETACGRDEMATALSVVVKPAGTVHADVVGPRGARTVLVELLDDAAWLPEAGDLGKWRWLHAGPGLRPMLGLRQALLAPGDGPDPEEAVLELLGEVVEAPAPPLGDAPAWVRRVREALDDLAPEGLRVEELAALVGVHPVSLTRAFRRAYGVPVTTYRQRLRLRHAAAAVVGSRRSLGAIAHAGGYADQAHLSRDVRRATGITPSRLREIASTAPPVRSVQDRGGHSV